MKVLAKLWDWWVELVDKLPHQPVAANVTLGMIRYNLEAREPGGHREYAPLKLTHTQCMELLADLRKRDLMP